MALVLALVLGAGGLACGKGGASPSGPMLAPAAPAAARRPRPSVVDRGFVGVIVAGESIEVEPKVEGRVQAVLVKPGDAVTRGMPLARLDVDSSMHELAIARAAFQDASRRLARRRSLARIRPGAVTADEIDGARREMLQEQARMARQLTARAEATVRAPVDGVVAERYLTRGALAGPGRALLRLVGRGVPRVRFAVPEDRAARLVLGQRVEIRIAASDRVLSGRVSGVSPEVDAASRMVYAAASLDPSGPAEDGRLTTGLVTRVFLPVAARGARP
jgi:RND family efflux transporter MFP subunit